MKEGASHVCESVIDLLSSRPMTEQYLPFYLLPLAYSPSDSMKDVVSKIETIVTTLVHDEQLQRETLVMVASIKWVKLSHSAAFAYIHRCLPRTEDSDTEPTLLRRAVEIVDDVIFSHYDVLPTYDAVIRRACEEKSHVPVLAVLATALFLADNYGHYNPTSDSIFAPQLPLTQDYTCEWDTAVVYGYMRLDGYIAWVMQSKKDELDHCIFITSDTSGPGRYELRVWHWLDKHLDWSKLYESVDQALKEQKLWDANQDWRNRIESRDIDFRENEIFIKLENSKYPLKFTIPLKAKAPEFDKNSLIPAYERTDE